MKTSAARGPALSLVREWLLPSPSVAAAGDASGADGSKSITASSTSRVPVCEGDAPTRTGTISPESTPALSPLVRSSWVSGSPSRYFVARSSSDSAIASVSRSRASSTSSSIPAGTSASGSVRLIEPSKLASAPMGTWMGTQFLPKASFMELMALSKSAFSRSILLMKMKRTMR